MIRMSKTCLLVALLACPFISESLLAQQAPPVSEAQTSFITLEMLETKTQRMLQDLKRRRDLEVLQLMHDAMGVLNGRQALVNYRKAEYLLAHAFKLDPENKQIPVVRQYMQLKLKRVRDQVNEHVRLGLKKPITVDFEENRFESVIEYLRKATKQNFYVNWAVLLNDAGIERDVPVNLNLRGIPADRVLDYVMKQVSVWTGELTPVDWSIKNGIVVISTVAGLKKIPETGRPGSFDLSALSHLSALNEAQGAELELKTKRMLEDLKQRRKQEVLQLMHDAMKVLDGRQDMVNYLKAQSMLAYAKKLDPKNDKVSFVLNLIQVKLTALKKQPNVQVWQALKKPVPAVFEENRLFAVIAYLRKQTGVNFYVDWPPLVGGAGIERDIPINLNLRGIPAEKVLDLVLQQVSTLTGELEPMTWDVDDGVVVISFK